jgi:hypothetical protein
MEKNKPVPRSLIWIHGSDVIDCLKFKHSNKMGKKNEFIGAYVNSDDRQV